MVILTDDETSKLLGAWPGKCDDCEVGCLLGFEPGNDGDGEGALRPSFSDDAWPRIIVIQSIC